MLFRSRLSLKLHGTSGRYGLLPKEAESSIWQKVCLWVNRFVFRNDFSLPVEYEFLAGSRRVQLATGTSGYHGSNDFRFEIGDRLNKGMFPGETIYGEIVGYSSVGYPIMGVHNLEKLNDKSLKKRYGSLMTYDYGCASGTCKFYIYRITQTCEDRVIELTTPQVQKRIKELMCSVEYVPELTEPLVIKENGPDGPVLTDGRKLDDLVEELSDGPDLLGNHIREGVVLRVEGPDGSTKFLKQKSFIFRVLEGIAKDNEEYVDTEEAA